MTEPTPGGDPPADREPVPLRHLAELDEITRDYARLTERETGAWTYLVVGVWIVGAELLFQASRAWGRLAFLALVPTTAALFLLERRLARPHGAVAYAPKDRRERDALRMVKIGIVVMALMCEWLALLSLFVTVYDTALSQLSMGWVFVALFVFPAVAAAPAVTPFLAGWRADGLLVLNGPLIIASTTFIPVPSDAAAAWLRHVFLLGVGCLCGVLAPFWIWMNRTQLRLLDQRMAHLRERLR